MFVNLLHLHLVASVRRYRGRTKTDMAGEHGINAGGIESRASIRVRHIVLRYDKYLGIISACSLFLYPDLLRLYLYCNEWVGGRNLSKERGRVVDLLEVIRSLSRIRVSLPLPQNSLLLSVLETGGATVNRIERT